MYRYCADCEFLKIDEKGNGKYKCTKLNKDVLANMEACDKFEFSYRNKVDRDKYYEMGKELEKKVPESPQSIGSLLLIAGILFLILIICLIFL